VLYRPFFAAVPTSQTVALGGQAIFTSAVSNQANLPLTNRWRRGNAFIRTNIVQVHQDTLTLSNVQTTDAAAYTCTWGNVAGQTALSTPFAYLVVVVPPTNQSVAAGANVTFSGQAFLTSSPRPLRYQWQFEETSILNATNASLTISNVQAGDVGTYTVLITNPQDMVTPFSAELTLANGSARLFDPEIAGDGSFRATVEGSANRTYSVEMSIDLTNWTEVRSLVMTNATVPFADSNATNAPQRFYRARLAD
jgi:hypothetical protein